MHFTLKTKPLRRRDLDEFVECFHPDNRHRRRETWGANNPEGRWRCYPYEELAKRDKLNLDFFGSRTRAWKTPRTCRTRTSWPKKLPMIWKRRWSNSGQLPAT
jgi:hypothetical protein